METNSLFLGAFLRVLILTLALTSGCVFAAEPVAVEKNPAANTKKALATETKHSSVQEMPADINQVSKNIQQLKQQVIDLNKELRLMEEKLLFPSSTKYTVFVSLSSGNFFTLEGIKLKIDEKIVSSHIYSEKQRQALIRGGVHKFYVTNLNEGSHSATLFFTGIGPGGRAYKRASTIDFKKGPSGEYLEVAISDDSVAQEPVFAIKQW